VFITEKRMKSNGVQTQVKSLDGAQFLNGSTAARCHVREIFLAKIVCFRYIAFIFFIRYVDGRTALNL